MNSLKEMLPTKRIANVVTQNKKYAKRKKKRRNP